MPRVPKAKLEKLENVMGEVRENVSLWMKQKIDEVQQSYEQRIELLRNGGEHPSPIYQKMVRQYALMGLEEKYICKMLFISHQVLMTHYEEDIKLGYAEGVITMGTTLYAIGSNPLHKDAAKVALEWLSRRGGKEWKPAAKKIELDDPNKNEGRIINSSELTYEQRQQLRAMILSQDPETPADDEGEEEDEASSGE